MRISADVPYPLRPIQAVVFPPDGIGGDQLPDPPIIRFIPDHMIVERFLPNGLADFFCNETFPLLNAGADGRPSGIPEDTPVIFVQPVLT